MTGNPIADGIEAVGRSASEIPWCVVTALTVVGLLCLTAGVILGIFIGPSVLAEEATVTKNLTEAAALPKMPA